MFGWLRNFLQREQSMSRLVDSQTRQLRDASDKNVAAAGVSQVSLDNQACEVDKLRRVLAGTLMRLVEK